MTLPSKIKLQFNVTKCSLNIQLKKHMKSVHGNNKPIPQSDEIFPCNVCELVFESFHLLQEHMKSHNTKSQISCRYCDFSTVDNNSLHEHLLECHEDIVILHTSAKQVDKITVDLVEIKMFINKSII